MNLTVLRVEGALVVVRVDSGELDLVAGLAHVAEVAEEDGVFRPGKAAGRNLLSKRNRAVDSLKLDNVWVFVQLIHKPTRLQNQL